MSSKKRASNQVKQPTLGWLGLFLLCLLGAPIEGLAQSNLPQSINLLESPYFIPLPQGFPAVPREGADFIEILRYQLEKDKWIQKNPDLYFKIAERPSLYSLAEQDSIRARKEEEMRVRNILPLRK